LANVESCFDELIEMFHVFFLGEEHVVSDVLHKLETYEEFKSSLPEPSIAFFFTS